MSTKFVKFPGTNLVVEEIKGQPLVDALAFVAFVTRSKTKFPGPNPVSISRSDFASLAKDAYWIAAKTDGVRAALVCFRSGGANYVAFLDRARRAYVARGNPFQLCTAWFEGTILDGEIVGSEFKIFDAAFVSGSNVCALKFSERRAAMRAGLDMHFAAQKEAPPLYFSEKDFLFPSEFDVDDAKARGADGLILMPENAPYVFGRHMSLFKLKTSHTIDFSVGAGGTLSIQDRGFLVAASKLDPADGPIPPAGSIAECEPVDEDADDIRWRAKVVRTDKDYPNDAMTYKNTLRDMREKIAYEELVALVRDLELRVYRKF
jgi:hypothetical protein